MATHLWWTLFVILATISTAFQCEAKTPDWLVVDVKIPTTVKQSPTGSVLLSNGLIRREFTIKNNFATIDYYDETTQSSLLRALDPEARVGLDGYAYDVGGVEADHMPRAYFNRSYFAHANITTNPKAFQYVKYTVLEPVAPFKYTPKRFAPRDLKWPPSGKRLDVLYKAPSSAPVRHREVTITVHYEMYDGIPLLQKWLTITSPKTSSAVFGSVYNVEYLSLNQQWAANGYGWMVVDSNQPHGSKVGWGTDKSANSMPGSFQPVVNCSYVNTFQVPLTEPLESFKVHELIVGSADKERVGLARRRMMRLLAPQTQENPIFFHMIDSHSDAVKKMIDQMAEVGFEMLIYSFGSGFNIESTDAAYISSIAEIVRYAHARDIEVGGYDLISLSRNPVLPQYKALKPNGQPSGNACFASEWYDHLLERFSTFINATGISMVETDGPYGGYGCSSSNHPHHHDVSDSIYQQNKKQAEFFKFLREKSMYINQPDNYFYDGGSKTGMGYNENQYSLPRWQDLSVSRQGMFDDTFHYIPSVGWMFLPLVVYHGGGNAAMFEPLKDHRTAYEWGLAQYMGAGVAACYRGYRLYDDDETKKIVIKWVTFYKQYRDILTSDIVHVRRADMQGIDSYMHVNQKLGVKALAMVFNPTVETIKTNLTLPLYYSGLTSSAHVSEQGMNAKVYTLERDYSIEIPINLPALGITWFVIK